jgi:peptidoglycan hydrolase CwlO-like protein
MNEFLITLITYILAPAISLLLGWYVGRRKSNADALISEADATRTEIENVEKVLTIYRGFVEELEAKVKQLKTQIDELQNKLDHVLQENQILKGK